MEPWNYYIIKSIGPVSYIVQVDNRTIKRHVDHIISASFQKLPQTDSSEIIINPEELFNSSKLEDVIGSNSEPRSTSSETTEMSQRPKRKTRPPDRLEYTSFK